MISGTLIQKCQTKKHDFSVLIANKKDLVERKMERLNKFSKLQNIETLIPLKCFVFNKFFRFLWIHWIYKELKNSLIFKKTDISFYLKFKQIWSLNMFNKFTLISEHWSILYWIYNKINFKNDSPTCHHLKEKTKHWNSRKLC